MTWKKHFKVHTSSPLTHVNSREHNLVDSKYDNYASYLPEVYIGHQNRIQRYTQYENMDVDSEVNAALDILAEFCTQKHGESGLSFEINWTDDSHTTRDAENVADQLKRWCNLNKFNQRMFKIFRNVLKYGDQVFIRDPETFELYWTDMGNVSKVIVNESQGKQPEQYVIKDINPNFENLTVTQISHDDGFYGSTPRGQGYIQPSHLYSSQGVNSRFDLGQSETAISAEHVVHASLTEGLDVNWPFGNSILENIFKVFKQKELLEDAVIIYRVQRAPERRAFYIDVGDQPSHHAMAFIERIKNEIHQRRIPSYTGGETSILDTTYNPLSMNEDFFFPQTCLDLNTRIVLHDGRVLSLQEIINEHKQGKRNFVQGFDDKKFKPMKVEIEWAGITRKDAQIIKITLNNDKEILATPDHKFVLANGSEFQAQNLNVGMPLLSVIKGNHTVKHIEYLEHVKDTGDITIKSDNHWFALEAGIYVHNSTGRGTKVETLPGGTNLGEIEDLKFFTNKLFRGLRIPSSYLPTGMEDSPALYADGRVGTALIQEYRFNEYCKRLQRLICETFDTEFKVFLKSRGFTIDNTMFMLQFNEPKNFSKYRETEMDSARISSFSSLEGYPFFSKRFLMERHLNMTEEEIAKNEKMWLEENHEDEAEMKSDTLDVRSVGITPGNLASDIDQFDTDIEGSGEFEGSELDDFGGDADLDTGGDTDIDIPQT